VYVNNSIKIVPPLGYIEFLNLMLHSRLILTDSGGIQEEATALKIPCLTLRENTERPVTIKEGTNILTGLVKENILEEISDILSGKIKKGKLPKLWDGKTSKRIVNTLVMKL
jgi:UDP-N-acetylglucosamine 2-epimerase (non-hydrolysing)